VVPPGRLELPHPKITDFESATFLGSSLEKTLLNHEDSSDLKIFSVSIVTKLSPI